MIGTLIKITANRKLMMKISETAFDSITDRLTSEYKKKDFPTDRLASFTLEDDDGNDNYFVMISLDKYDKQCMRKFEQLLKKDVAFQFRLKPYDFIPDGQDEQVCGINLELISIRQVKAKPSPFVQLMDEMVAAAKKPLIRRRRNPVTATDSDSEIDEIADKAADRAIDQSSELNAEEQAIDEAAAKKVEEHIAAMQKMNLLHRSPLKLTEAEYSAEVKRVQSVIRRRRTHTATETELSEVTAEIEKDDLIGAEE